MTTKTKLKEKLTMENQVAVEIREEDLEKINQDTIENIIEEVEVEQVSIMSETNNKKEVSKMTTHSMLKPEISDEFKDQLRAELKVIRALTNWSQKDLCEALGTATTQITSVEREEKHLSDTQYFVLLYLLNLELKRNSRLKKYMDTNCEDINNEISKFFN